MNVEKICRCCLTNEGPLLTIFDEDDGTITNKNCLAVMIMEIAQIKTEPNDKLPDKACLSCIREINQCYAFKIKCENSNRTLQQLFCSKALVQLQNTPESFEIKEDPHTEKPPVDSSENILDDEIVMDVKIENNIEATLHKSFVYKNVMPTTSVDSCISISSSPISFQNSVPTVENDAEKEFDESDHEYSHHNHQEQEQHTNSETDSCDSIEFMTEKNDAMEPIVMLDENVVADNRYDDNVDVDDTDDVEFEFENISSPQWVPDEECYLSIVNEDLNFDNVQLLSCNKIVEDLNIEGNSGGGGARYQCGICKEAFFFKNELSTHFATHEKPYSCIYCKKLFDEYSTLRQHLLGHINKDGTIKKPKKTRTKTKTKTKSKRRPKEKSYACDMCPMKFHATSILNNHRRTHTGEKPFQCNYCDRSFTQKSTLMNHKKVHTRDCRYKCQYCDKKFIQSGTRASHEMTHTGEKPHKCRYCSRGFIQLGVKQKHEESHLKKDIKCTQCEMSFIRPSDLFKHVEMKHS